LKLLDWNVAIDSAQWDRWMAYITAYHSVLARYQPISRDYGIIACLIDRVNRKDPHWNCDCESKNKFNGSPSADDHTDADSFGRSLPNYSQCPPQLHSPSSCLPNPIYSVWWRPEAGPIIHRPSQAIRNVAPSMNGEPAPWCPAVDPIMETARTARTMGTTLGSAWVEPVTALGILEDITAGRYPLLPSTSRHFPAEAVNAGSPSSSRGVVE
jgi:hypothetical protein